MVAAAVDMSVVHGKHSDPQETGQCSGKLVSVDRSVFGESEGKVAIASWLGFVDKVRDGAVHRLKIVFAVVELHWRKHEVGVIRQVPRHFK